ncbi:MAG TPA: GAF domain-containing protein, partial [Steroidobacteraceae bacterium]|nr:GAF domain-containing protein [Steroidobacteraceae bacterium]
MTGSQSDRAEFLLTLSDALRALSDPDEIVREAAHVLGERLGASRVLYVEVHGPSAVVATDWVAGVASLEGRAPPLAYAANLLAALRRGETLIVNDLENDPRLDAEESAGFRTVDTSALIVTALMRDGQAVAALSAHSATPRVWTDLEVDLLRETASRAWSAAQQATAERRASELEAALRESDQRLRTAQALAGVGVWDWDVAGDQMHVSPEMDQIYGVWPQASR